MQEPKKILFVIYSLPSGGAERVMSVMANYWAERKWDIKLLTIENRAGDFYELNPAIDRINLELGEDAHSFLDGIKNNYHHIKAIRKVYKQHQPDCIISFMDTTNILAILAATGINIPVIVSERINPNAFSIGTAWNKLRSWVYPHTSSLVVQTDDIADWGRKFIDPAKVDIIPNPVWINDSDLEADSNTLDLPMLINDDTFLIFAMGRLNHQKGFDTLIKAFKQSNLVNQNSHLIILGEGELRFELEQLISEQELEQNVHLPGRVAKPHPLIKNADIFVLSSRYEGFPNVLVEAMAIGCAVISTDCPSGPSVIIEDEVNGLLVPVDDVNLLADKLKDLFKDSAKREILSRNAIKVRETYSIESVMGQWESVIKRVCSES